MSQVYLSNGIVAVCLPVGTECIQIDTANYGDNLEVTFLDKDMRRLRVDGGLDPNDTYRLFLVTAEIASDAVNKTRIPMLYQY